MTDSQVQLACDLLGRAGVASDTIKDAETLGALEVALDVACDIFNERAPDAKWFRDYFSLTGDHWVLTEEGWIPAEMNTREATGSDPVEVLDEVNAP